VRTMRIQGSVLGVTGVLALVVSNQRSLLAEQAQQRPATSSTAKASDVEKAIRETAQRFVDAFNKGDAKTVAALWAEDGDYIDEMGDRTSGRESIQKKYTTFFGDNRDAKIDVTIDSVRQVGPDTAIEDGHSKLVCSGHAGSAATGRYTVVHVKRNGKWLIASARDLPADSSPQNDSLADLDWMIGVWHAEHLGVEMTIDCRWLADRSFVEATYSKQEGNKVAPTATQIIGVDPRNGRITSWMFSADRGYAHGVWMPHDSGWAIEFDGVSADGTLTTAINVLSRVNDALVWKSTNRTVAGHAVPDTEEVVLKRK
jgi:uncharacterized protein (TIGR02246 family)